MHRELFAQRVVSIESLSQPTETFPLSYPTQTFPEATWPRIYFHLSKQSLPGSETRRGMISPAKRRGGAFQRRWTRERNVMTGEWRWTFKTISRQCAATRDNKQMQLSVREIPSTGSVAYARRSGIERFQVKAAQLPREFSLKSASPWKCNTNGDT